MAAKQCRTTRNEDESPVLDVPENLAVHSFLSLVLLSPAVLITGEKPLLSDRKTKG